MSPVVGLGQVVGLSPRAGVGEVNEKKPGRWLDPNNGRELLVTEEKSTTG